jgi:hypothetical protein
MNKILLYFIIFLILLLLITLDSYSYKGVEIFRHYAEMIAYPVSVPFFDLYKYLNSFFESVSEKSTLIKAMQTYYDQILALRKENSLLKNQLDIYRYVFKSYSQFSNIPDLKASIVQVKLMVGNIFLMQVSLKKAYAIDSNGNFIGFVKGDKLYTIYSKDFKCKIRINDSDKYGVLERSKGIFTIKYLQSIPDGKIFMCDDNLEIPMGEVKNKKFYPYFVFHYIPKAIVLWEATE